MPKGNRGGWRRRRELVLGTPWYEETLGENEGKAETVDALEMVAGTINHPYEKLVGSYQKNCQRCVNTFEMARRGYWVFAKPYKGENDSYAYSSNENGYAHFFKGQQWNSMAFRANGMGTDDKNIVVGNVVNEVKSWGDGGSGIIKIRYKGDTGHVFNVVNRKGEVLFIDAQDGRVMKETDPYLASHYWNIMKPEYTYISRVDNLEPASKKQINASMVHV